MDLTFAVMIDSSMQESDLIQLLFERLPDATQVGGYIESSSNVMKLEWTSLSIPKPGKSLDTENPWLYYRFELSVFPVEDVFLENQVVLANTIVSILRQFVGQAELIAEFQAQC